MSDLAGATATIPLPNAAASTPGQFAARWNLHTEQQRQDWLDGMHEAVERGQTCFMQDHARHLAALEEQVFSPATANGRRLTWQELAEQQAAEIRRLQEFATMISDLDRNVNGRHEGDADTGDPTGRSRGNPKLHTGDVLGYSIHGTHVYRMPDREHRHDPAAWRTSPTEQETTA